ncbi:MAG TPA: class I SAM-dependent methyltransferase [Rhodopila sp.]|jgi:hypothetical protein
MSDQSTLLDHNGLVRAVSHAVGRELLGKFTNSHSLPHIAELAESVSSAQYFVEKMQKAARFKHKPDYLDHAIAACTVDGLVLEFGVGSGGTINHIASATNGAVFGFDTFTGLPEDWRPGYPAGAFAQPALPAVLENVELVVGLFADTLPRFVEAHTGPVSLLHVDCDLYSSTKVIFRYLAHKIVPGTVILFDEYLNYPGWRQHEFKAFQEYITWSGQSYDYISVIDVHQQVGVRITG